MILDEDVDGEDFLEFILSTAQVKKLLDSGIVQNFPDGIFEGRNLNVFIRVDKAKQEEDMPLVKKKRKKP